jgi:hypothetical protein
MSLQAAGLAASIDFGNEAALSAFGVPVAFGFYASDNSLLLRCAVFDYD